VTGHHSHMRHSQAKNGHTVGGFLTGFGAGVVAAYFLDPDDGRRRRAMARDRAQRTVREARGFLHAAGRDLRNRATGVAARIRSRVRGRNISDEVLEARVRAELGRVVLHPHAVEVACDDGRVTLTGSVHEDEADDLVARVRAVPGVSEIDNLLEIHDGPADIPGPHGPGSLAPRESWTPGVRLIAGAAGGILGLSGGRRGGLTGLALRALGIGLIARAVADRPISKIVGRGDGALQLHEPPTVAAPHDEARPGEGEPIH
jgi:osmotically-inducible protein OsmY